MKFRFIGDPNHNFSGPNALERFGYEFNRTDWTEVKDKAVIAKLLGHSHFESYSAVSEPTSVVEDERACLIRDAEAIGIVVDRRWANATIKLKIDQALMA